MEITWDVAMKLARSGRINLYQCVESVIPNGAIFEERIIIKRALRIASALEPRTEASTVEKVVDSLIKEGKWSRVATRKETYIERGFVNSAYNTSH